MGVKFGVEGPSFGSLLRAKFHPHRCNVSPMRGEKPQNRPLSKLNTGRLALRAMLPVKTFVRLLVTMILTGQDEPDQAEEAAAAPENKARVAYGARERLDRLGVDNWRLIDRDDGHLLLLH